MDKRQQFSKEDYNEILLNAIPMLNYLPRCSGGEGTAYFYGEDYVIKQYNQYQDWEYFDSVFELYCKEQQRYSDKGYAVPKIYSYTKLPNMNFYYGKAKNKYNYYILEERLPGRHLFHGYLDDIYPAVKGLFSYNEFKQILARPDERLAEFKEIAKIFINDYIQMNEMVESMSEQELGKFVAEMYDVYMTSVYSVPDIHPSNVLVSDNHLSMIDNQMIDAGHKKEKSKYLEGSFVNDLLNLFFLNNEIFDMSNGVLFSLKNKRSVNFSYLKQKNTRACKAAIIKTVQAMNKYCDNPTIKESRMAMIVFSTLNNVMTMNDSVEVMTHIKMAKFGE